MPLGAGASRCDALSPLSQISASSRTSGGSAASPRTSRSATAQTRALDHSGQGGMVELRA